MTGASGTPPLMQLALPSHCFQVGSASHAARACTAASVRSFASAGVNHQFLNRGVSVSSVGSASHVAVAVPNGAFFVLEALNVR